MINNLVRIIILIEKLLKDHTGNVAPLEGGYTRGYNWVFRCSRQNDRRVQCFSYSMVLIMSKTTVLEVKDWDKGLYTKLTYGIT